MMTQSLSTDHGGGVCCLSAWHFNAIFYCFDVISSGVLGSVLCLQNQALCAAIICSISGLKLSYSLC